MTLRLVTFLTFLTFFAAPALAEVAPVALPVAPPVALTGGTAAALVGTDLRLVLTGVTDRRCPSDLTCVWEGTKRLVIRINPGGPAEQTIVLCNACDGGGRRATVAGYQFDFVGLEPGVRVIEGLGRAARVEDYTGFVQITALSSQAG